MNIGQRVGENEDIQNFLFFGDNLPIMAKLLDDREIAGKVRLVYIDPPYATQTSFHSRKLSHAYEDNLTGAEFIEFLRTRLILLRELLAEDGSIYLHLDEKMIFHIKVIMDEVFGANNYKNCIVRKKCNPKNYTRKKIRITGYPTEKNPELIKRLIEASSNPNDIVLDCFCGSGTTLEVAHRLERRWIGIDNSAEAISTILDRFAKGTEIMGDFVSKGKNKKNHPSLFESVKDQGERETSASKHRPIKDFSLLADVQRVQER